MFAHPCFGNHIQGGQTENQGGQTEIFFRRFAPNFLSKNICPPWPETVPAPLVDFSRSERRLYGMIFADH